MTKLDFVLTPEQHEVLAAFEDESSLADVARRVLRDPSVVSRTLKSIAETAPLLEKHQGKWRITPLGRQFNRLTKSFLSTQRKLIAQDGLLRLSPYALPVADETAALILLGTQLGFQSSAWGPRNNPDAELKIKEVLTAWRERKNPLVFCRHLSKERGSPLFEGTSGSAFISGLEPAQGELVVGKHRNSAFAGTDLLVQLTRRGIRNVVLAGFSTSHCVDATARAANDAGFNVFVVSDACAAFDRVGPDGKHYSAETLHASTLATLHQEYATVIDSDVLMRHLADPGLDAPDA